MGRSLGAEGRAVLGHLVLLWALVVPGIQQEIRLSQRPVMVGYAGGAMTMPCHVSRSVDYVHWFRQLEGQAPERLLYLALSKRDMRWDSVLGSDKVSAGRGGDGKSCTMSLMKLAKSDEGLYYCAAWDWHSSARSPGICTKSTETHCSPRPGNCHRLRVP